MFLAIVIILLGVFLLLNAMGIIVGNFWGYFWAIVLIAVGVSMLIKRGKCPMCGCMMCKGMMHGKMSGHMDGKCCGHNHEKDIGEEME